MFFDKIIKAIKSFSVNGSVNSFYQDIIDKRRNNAEESRLRAAYFQSKIDTHAVTTKTLKAISKEINKKEVSKNTLKSFISRSGISKQDIDIISRTLDEFSGDTINVAEFLNSAYAKLMPLSVKILPDKGGSFADYGKREAATFAKSKITWVDLATKETHL
jgi:hypothetical protein